MVGGQTGLGLDADEQRTAAARRHALAREVDALEAQRESALLSAQCGSQNTVKRRRISFQRLHFRVGCVTAPFIIITILQRHDLTIVLHPSRKLFPITTPSFLRITNP